MNLKDLLNYNVTETLSDIKKQYHLKSTYQAKCYLRKINHTTATLPSSAKAFTFSNLAMLEEVWSHEK